MKLTIEVDLDNAAFYDSGPADEVRRVLSRVVDGIETIPCGPSGIRKNLLDSNGNRVGYWQVTR